MPTLSQRMVRTALIWWGVGFTMGALVLVSKGLVVLPWLWSLRMSHVHVLLVGWLVQFACGVAFWILPRLDAQGSRGDERPVYITYIALNAGVVLAALDGPLTTLGLDMLWLPLVAGGLYVLGGCAFAAHAWRRVLPFRTLPRPGKSQR